LFSLQPQIFLGGKDSPQKRAQFEFMATCVQSRVGEHGNPGKLYLVQYAAHHISTTTSTARLTSSVYVVLELVSFIAAVGHYAVVGTDHAAHTTANTSIGRVGLLPDTIVHLVNIARLGFQSHGGLHQPLTMHSWFYGINRTDRGAVAAQGTLVPLPKNLPWQVLGT
jgi:hypothetical protein